MDQLDQLKIGGNNRRRSKKTKSQKPYKKRARARSWFFTKNNYTQNDVDQLDRENFFENLDVAYFIIQEEIGDEGTKHLQGTVHFHKLVSFKKICAVVPKADFSVVDDIYRSLNYCGKTKTRNGKIWTKGNVDKYVEIEPDSFDDTMKKIKDELFGKDRKYTGIDFERKERELEDWNAAQDKVEKYWNWECPDDEFIEP